MSDAIQGLDTYRRPRFETLVLGSFAFLALILVGLGVFSLVSATVSFRRRELAVRSAVGASPRRLVRLILRELLLPVCAGLSSGAFGTWVASSMLQARQADFHGVGGQLTVVVILVVVVVAMIAAYVPTRRVSHIDPAITLRAE